MKITDNLDRNFMQPIKKSIYRHALIGTIALLLGACASNVWYSKEDANQWVKNSPYLSVSNAEGRSENTKSFSQESSFAAPESTALAEENVSNQRDKVLEIAKKQLGTPYQYGGESPSGFDCSGLTSYVYKQVSVELPRSAEAQFEGLQPVNRPEPGDLLFFGKNGKIDHVGIYIGGRKMIHAPQSGKAVEKARIDTSYWKPRYQGARRVANRPQT